MHVELLDRIHKEHSACSALAEVFFKTRFREVISLCFTAIEYGVNWNLQTAAITVKQPAEIQTNLKPKLYASKRPPTPAPIIWGVTPGIEAIAVWLFAARSPINAGRDAGLKPSGRTAPAIFVPRLAVNLAVKIALSAFSISGVLPFSSRFQLTDC